MFNKQQYAAIAPVGFIMDTWLLGWVILEDDGSF